MPILRQKITSLWTLMDFTGGDMTLIPKLMEFNEKKDQWNNEMVEKQTAVDKFMEDALRNYFEEMEREGKV